MAKLVRENSLTLVTLLLFALSVIGQALTGWSVYNSDQVEHGSEEISLPQYLGTGHFGEAIFENWESEFLQMGLFVLLTVSLRQKGSPESKSIDGEEEVDREPDPRRPGAPWPVRAGGLAAALYARSLSIALLGLFVLSFALHVGTGAAAYSEEQQAHGQGAVSPLEYVATPRLWFESLQNWQSEFMSIGALVVLSVFLRQKGSSESMPVDDPVGETGG
ncbi:MAG TPA: DUF6766 family protein [Candidatus Limnocylindrales bacterium]|nr:DUF6766 family protein [Candidatus Limnocylindrales bacterium]